MKKLLLISILICVGIEITNAQEKLPIDTSQSEIAWSGEYTFYFGGHNGTIAFKEGHFVKMNDVITSGSFIIDMHTIICLDIDAEEANESLVGHLKDPDFFDVPNHPTASLEITSVDYHDTTSMQIYADLTIKGITNSIKFQATVDYEKKEMKTKFKIDRMLWDVTYNSDMRDSALSDAIGFEVTLKL